MNCLFARRGMLPYQECNGKRAQGTTLIQAPRGKHSVKPEALRRMAELVSYPPRLEMFARAAAPGWDSWGNQAPVETAIVLPSAEVVVEEM